MVKNYAEWTAAVEKEFEKMAAVSEYLSDEGRERLEAFEELGNQAAFHRSALELWRSIQADEHSADVQHRLESRHITQALRVLGDLADGRP